MEIIVCIKQVPDTTEVKIDPEKGTLMREGVPSIVNPFDKNAVEAALQIRDEKGGKVTVITMGPPQAVDALRECLAMGADEAVLLSDRAFASSDTWATSYTLAMAIEKIGNYDLILCGKQAIDGDTAQVGPGIAEHIGLPQVTYVQKIREANDDGLVVERAIEGGYEVLTVGLPAMIAVEKSINEPRFPTMMGTMKAHKKEVPTWGAAEIEADEDKLGMNGSPTRVKRIFAPERKSQGEMIEGDDENAVCTVLVEKLLDKKVI
ncbi:electron transfer flavoprotein subunit beta/FixA family protein [Dethiobacter alkaliphilus]|uniref:electron transfer flavoprotein subunit beta/FixA family protein n=1 Tax=Dethiobacter alkaliphilus TaxID=427926 RepID=UPI002226CF94|nr:electron transfer flavoprotein subunit beta/FixA family protein [Dethiobacter alkaliphilus]MCW3491315.1 electron transfer flavoprotein subunit beta/FixA family protein [Dethiobacter alkaliphilus]